MRIDNKHTIPTISIAASPGQEVAELPGGVDLAARNGIDRACFAGNEYHVATIGASRR